MVAVLISCSYFVLNAPLVLPFNDININLKGVTVFDVPFSDDDNDDELSLWSG